MRVFYDVDTQNDFMNKDGALYVPDAELIKPNLAVLTQFARTNGLRVVGSVDRHFGDEKLKPYELELVRWGGPFPDHCMDGTPGQWKIKETALNNALFVENPAPGAQNGKSDEQIARLAAINKNIFFEKQGYSVFPIEDCPGGNKYAERFLKQMKVNEAVVYGVATDFCVRAAVLGMQQRGVQCYVVEDAIKGVFPDKTQAALEEMAGAGARFVKTADVLEGRI